MKRPPMPQPRSDPTRADAFDLLSAVLERHRSLEDALAALPAADARDRAAAHRLAASVLRRTGSLDAVLEPWLRRAPPEGVRQVLRLGAAGLLLADTPPHAAVATAVALARARGFAPFTGLVNAVLRRVAEAGAASLVELDGPRLDTPAWLWSSWGADARAIATAHTAEAPLDVTFTGDQPSGGTLLPTGTLRFPPGTRVTELPGFEDGRLWVQDAAAALPARLLAAQPGEQVADLCAAPGGKAAQLAATGATVFAVERDGRRIARLRENLTRLKLSATVVEADRDPVAPARAAPCGASGRTVLRHRDDPPPPGRAAPEAAARRHGLRGAAARTHRGGGGPAPARRAPGLRRLLPAAGGGAGRAAGRGRRRAPARSVHDCGTCRASGGTHGGWLPSARIPAYGRRAAGWTGSSPRGSSGLERPLACPAPPPAH